MKRLLLTLLLLTPLCSWAQFYQPGEQLTYRVSYRAKLVPNTEVATVTINTTNSSVNGISCYKVAARAKTTSAFKWFFDLDDRYYTYVNPSTLRPLRFESNLKENDYTFWSKLDYDWSKMRVDSRWQSRKRPVNSRTIPLTDESMDAISLFFKLRGEQADNFRPGQRFKLKMVLEDTVRNVELRFIGREQKKIRKLGLHNTLKFACQLRTSEGESFEDGDEFFVWISDDRNKVPLWLESPIRVGSVQAYLVDYNGLRYPLESGVE